jgi:hypothetical protein
MSVSAQGDTPSLTHLVGDSSSTMRAPSSVKQGLTLVHFSAQLEPCLTHTNTLHTINIPLNMGCTIPTHTPYPIKSAQVELRSERV